MLKLIWVLPYYTSYHLSAYILQSVNGQIDKSSNSVLILSPAATKLTEAGSSLHPFLHSWKNINWHKNQKYDIITPLLYAPFITRKEVYFGNGAYYIICNFCYSKYSRLLYLQVAGQEWPQPVKQSAQKKAGESHSPAFFV